MSGSFSDRPADPGLFGNRPLEDLTFAIVGLGLICGSSAKALRNLRVKRVLGADISHGIAHACLNANMIDDIVELNRARNEFTELINQVNQVLQFIVTGNMEEAANCTGSCATCGGGCQLS